MENSATKPIEQIEIGDRTRGGFVTMLVRGEESDIWDYRGIRVTSNQAVMEEGEWLRVHQSSLARSVNNGTPRRVYDFDTTDHRIWINDVEFSDFSEAGPDNWVLVQKRQMLIAELNDQ